MKLQENFTPDNLWYTSDTHFGHKTVARIRGYASVEAHDEDLIRIWNENVKPNDIVFHLGDLSFVSNKRTIDILSRLNGRITIVYGNHDDKVRSSADVRSMVHLASDYFRINVDDQKIILCHFPIAYWRDSRHGSWHLHGHMHGDPTGVKGAILDVGWDTKLRPYRHSEVADILKDRKPKCQHEKAVGVKGLISKITDLLK